MANLYKKKIVRVRVVVLYSYGERGVKSASPSLPPTRPYILPSRLGTPSPNALYMGTRNMSGG